MHPIMTRLFEIVRKKETLTSELLAEAIKLIHAIQAIDLEAKEESHKKHLYSQDETGKTILHWALELNNHSEIATLLFDLTKTTPTPLTPLMCAAASGDLETVRSLIKAKKNIHATVRFSHSSLWRVDTCYMNLARNRSALDFAVDAKPPNLDIVKELLLHINEFDSENFRVLKNFLSEQDPNDFRVLECLNAFQNCTVYYSDGWGGEFPEPTVSPRSDLQIYIKTLEALHASNKVICDALIEDVIPCLPTAVNGIIATYDDGKRNLTIKTQPLLSNRVNSLFSLQEAKNKMTEVKKSEYTMGLFQKTIPTLDVLIKDLEASPYASKSATPQSTATSSAASSADESSSSCFGRGKPGSRSSCILS